MRFKALHYYNHGAIFEAIFSIFTPFLKKKVKDRVGSRRTKRKSNGPKKYMREKKNKKMNIVSGL